jgi:hypothetical protein
VVRALEKEEWLKVLHPHWTTAKVDVNGLAQLMKTRQQMVDLGYTVDPSAAVMHFLTAHLSDKDISDLQRQIPRKDLVQAWRDIEDHAKDLAKRLTGKEAATPSRTWNLLSSAKPEMVLFLAVTARHQTVAQKIKNYPHQMAAGAAAHPAAGNDRVADHAATARVSQDCARRLHALARRQTALSHRDLEILEAVAPRHRLRRPHHRDADGDPKRLLLLLLRQCRAKRAKWRRARGNRYGYGAYGYPWLYGGLYDPYWWWDSGSSFDYEKQYETGLANEMNQQSLDQQSCVRQHRPIRISMRSRRLCRCAH